MVVTVETGFVFCSTVDTVVVIVLRSGRGLVRRKFIPAKKPLMRKKVSINLRDAAVPTAYLLGSFAAMTNPLVTALAPPDMIAATNPLAQSVKSTLPNHPIDSCIKPYSPSFKEELLLRFGGRMDEAFFSRSRDGVDSAVPVWVNYGAGVGGAATVLAATAAASAVWEAVILSTSAWRAAGSTVFADAAIRA